MESVYSKNGYLKIWAEYDHADSLELYVEQDEALYKITFLVKPLKNNPGFFEAYTPYGYGGPFVIAGNPQTEFPYQKLCALLKERNIVDVFLRFSPFAGNHLGFPPGVLSLNRYTVSRCLSDSQFSYSTNTREKLHKSKKAAVKVSLTQGSAIGENQSKQFNKLYVDNMRLVGARDYYLLDDQCIRNHSDYLRDNIDLYTVEIDGEWAAAALFLNDEKAAHYHLGASERKFTKLYPMYRLFSEAIDYYSSCGKSLLHFGGGLSLDPEDTLFQFKKKFGDQIHEFYIGKMILDNVRYLSIRTENSLEDSPYFLINDALDNK